MMKIKILNKKEVKKIVNSLKEQYSISDLKLDYIFILGVDDKIYVVDRHFAELYVNNLRVNSVGMYFGKLEGGKVRLSIEGSQIIGPHARKNVVDLSKDEIQEWVRGDDIMHVKECKDIQLVRYGKDFYGSGKCVKGKILNFVPKSRRIKATVKS